ncbi:hypothetical protein GCM10010409_13710 [Mycolicibacterium diernhoferi]
MPVDLLLDDGLQLVQELQIGQFLGHEPSDYVYLLVAVRVSVYSGDIQVSSTVVRVTVAPRYDDRWVSVPGEMLSVRRRD